MPQDIKAFFYKWSAKNKVETQTFHEQQVITKLQVKNIYFVDIVSLMNITL